MGGHCAAADLSMLARPGISPRLGQLLFPYCACCSQEQQDLNYLGRQAVLLSLRRSKGQYQTWRFLHIAKKRCMETATVNLRDRCQAMHPCFKSEESILSIAPRECLTIQTSGMIVSGAGGTS